MIARLLILPAIVVAGLATAESAAAQAPAGEACSGLATQAEEIACLRALLDRQRAAPVAPAQAPAVLPAAPAVPSAPEPRLGAEQVERSAPKAEVAREQKANSERVTATVVESRRDHRGLLVMQLDNGEIWRQEEATALPVRIDEDERVRVEIARSGFGGYRMNFPDQGRRVAVSRLR